jgi:hypothetical protein
MDGVGRMSPDPRTFIQKDGDFTTKVKVPASGETDALPQGEGDVIKPSQEATTMSIEQIAALTAAVSNISANLKPGESVKVNRGKEEMISVEKTGPTNWDRAIEGMGKMASRTASKAVDLGRGAIEADPSFVFRETVEALKRPMAQNAPEVIQEMMLAKGLYPGIRGALLALDIRKAWKTLHNPQAKMMDKILDVAHCLFDVGAIVAAGAPLLGLAIPGANILAVSALVADTIIGSYHAIKGVVDANEAYKKRMAAEAAANGKPKEPETNAIQLPQAVKPQVSPSTA